VLFAPGWRSPIRQTTVLAIFTIGLLLGGALAAGVLWLLSGLTEPVPQTGRVIAVLSLAAFGTLREFGVLRLELPQNARQIPQEILQRRLRLGALQFGFELGTGVRTYLSSTTPYILAVGLLLTLPGLVATVSAGLAFGLGRALTPTLSIAGLDRSWDHRRMSRIAWITRGSALAVFVALGLLLFHQI
jgi:hypothetical protein